MTVMQYLSNNGRMYSTGLVKLSPESVPGRALYPGFARIYLIAQKIRCTLRYMTRGKGTDVGITGPQDEESNESGVDEV
jgi:hypothetical protein